MNINILPSLQTPSHLEEKHTRLWESETGESTRKSDKRLRICADLHHVLAYLLLSCGPEISLMSPGQWPALTGKCDDSALSRTLK